ncbi:hypothetical protein SAMN05880590_102411 [Rhizobium sp. RU35A]|uniref:Uncharacterized protein n=1 Tax=Rhizobium straminoryzae TaxID=1387186 RepID=A0A549SY33_9HYPH|nr:MULTISPECIES: hypothetical protein [Rhizobium]TRL34526.1 hypothetical protein FNA46_21745 [Rhizobium straminoryzae]SIQ17376.1 hypothetical protein SAMN05880590_102411 [Rhizobium sp. RU35A]
MFSDLAAWLITAFVLNPVQAELRQELQQADASVQMVQQVQQCVASEGPRLIERATGEPVWAVRTAIGLTLGWTSPVSLLDASNPNCAPILRLIDRDTASDASV